MEANVYNYKTLKETFHKASSNVICLSKALN